MTAAQRFEWRVRVYYEDTDAGGIVYYANYLKFMERARTEWLRQLGIDVGVLARENGSGFVVRSARLEFMKPARLSDELTVSVELTEKRQASVTLFQQVSKDDEILCAAGIRLAYVDLEANKPQALPEFIKQEI